MQIDASICFHNKFKKIDEELYSLIPCYDVFEKYYRDFDEKIRIPDLYGKTLRVSKRQLSNIYDLVNDICFDFHMETPEVFVFENYYYEFESYGINRPWIELSASAVTEMSEKELMFFLSREIFKIKTGITARYMVAEECQKFVKQHNSIMLFSEHAEKVLNLKYSQWSRLAQYSADCFGFLVVEDFELVVKCILLSILNNRVLASQINIKEYLNDSIKIDQMSSAIYNYTKGDEKIPYGQYRIKNLISFICNNIV